jgi:hypothetical protein
MFSGAGLPIHRAGRMHSGGELFHQIGENLIVIFG